MNWLPRIAVVLALQTAVLFAMVGIKQYTLATGIPVVLETQPIDPRSLFRGDYVRLNYVISELDTATLAGDDDYARGDAVYVVLRHATPYATPVSLHRTHPGPRDGHVVIEGTVTHTGRGMTPHTILVRYGIEAYFVPEGEGLALERPAAGETVSIEVAVDRFGNAGITAVLVDDERRYEETLF